MGLKRKKRDWGNLIEVFSSLSEGYVSADEQLHGAVKIFCIKLQTENISHASKNTSGKVWGASPLLILFCEVFDPILIKIFQKNSYTNQRLLKYKVTLPLVTHLENRESGKAVAEQIGLAIIDLESLISFGATSELSSINLNHSGQLEILQDMENLELIARLLLAMHLELDLGARIKWCDICFRLTSGRKRYCEPHSSKNDTKYRKALSIKANIPFDIQERFLRLHSKRQALGNRFTLVFETSDIPDKVTPDTQVMYVDEIVRDLVQHTISKKWAMVSKNWDMILDTVPHVKKRIKTLPSSNQSWIQFTGSVFSILDNKYENTIHPYWFLQMLAEAEIWFQFEDGLEQEIETIKKDEILIMISQGLRNRDIVNKLNVANSYVSELRKKYNKNRTSHQLIT